MAYTRLFAGIKLLSPVTVLHVTIDLYNCAVEMLESGEIEKAIEWAGKTLDCSKAKQFDDKLVEKRDSIVLNTSRLLGEFDSI